MASASKTFSAKGVGPVLSVFTGESFTYAISGTFSGTVRLEQSVSGSGWKVLQAFSAPASGTITAESNKALTRYRLRCTALASGSIVTTLADVDTDVQHEFRARDGRVLLTLTEAGALGVDGGELGGGLDLSEIASGALLFNDGGEVGGSARLRWDGSQFYANVITVEEASDLQAGQLTAWAEDFDLTNSLNALYVEGWVAPGRTVPYPHAMIWYTGVEGEAAIAYGFEGSIDLYGTITEKAYSNYAVTYLNNGVSFTGAGPVQAAGLWLELNCNAAEDTGLDGFAHIFLAAPAAPVATSMAAFYGLWVGDLNVAGLSNPYYFWGDSRGVIRIREDDDADSGNPQAIISGYNPRFTKYVPAAADYERWVIQHVNDVIQFGAEAGGTGTLQKVQIIGAGLLTNATLLPTANPNVAGQLWNDAGTVKVSAG